MSLRASTFHPVIAIFPMSLLASSLALDAMALTRGAPFFPAARWALGAGAIAGALVSVAGIVDVLRYPSGARGVGWRHGILNGVAIVLMALGCLRRGALPGTAPDAIALTWSLLAATVMIVAWRLGMRLTPAPAPAPRVGA